MPFYEKASTTPKAHFFFFWLFSPRKTPPPLGSVSFSDAGWSSLGKHPLTRAVLVPPTRAMLPVLQDGGRCRHEHNVGKGFPKDAQTAPRQKVTPLKEGTFSKEEEETWIYVEKLRRGVHSDSLTTPALVPTPLVRVKLACSRVCTTSRHLSSTRRLVGQRRMHSRLHAGPFAS